MVGKLRQLVASKDRLVNAMTHELRTPIHGILALASDVLKNGALKPAEARCARARPRRRCGLP